MRSLKVVLFTALTVSIAFTLFASDTKLPEAKDGLYVNQEKGFSVEYPPEWEKAPPPNPMALLFVKSPSVFFLNLGVYAGTNPIGKLETLPQSTVARWARQYPKSSEHKVESERMIELECGTEAIEFVISWNWGPMSGGEPVPIKTTCVVAEAGDGWVWVDSTSHAGESIELNRKLTNSLKFYK